MDKALIFNKKFIRKVFNPSKYSMNFCHGCNGIGKISNKDKFTTVCQVCGGFGLIKNQENWIEGKLEHNP